MMAQDDAMPKFAGQLDAALRLRSSLLCEVYQRMSLKFIVILG